MDTEPRPEERQGRSSAPWAAISVTAGAAFGIIALLHAPGIAYAIVAIVAGLCYSLIHLYYRRRD
jgi:sterol desaturase/sphingolipid hydroxylase (fatty acid hydroxylase superfamily)